ncbi:MAG: hypothetical protein ACI8QC_001115 [Planctomycetota bacterium]|jgi:hypothetical protein
MRILLSVLSLALFSSCTCLCAGSTSLFNGTDLSGWHTDIPQADDNADLPPSFEARDGMLVSNGNPQGHLITDASYSDYRLEIEYRWSGEPGNCGVLIHASTPRYLYGMFPKSIEAQMYVGNAGDFWCIGEDISVDNMVERRGAEEKWGGEEGEARRIKNTTDGSEAPTGEWNTMVVECRGSSITVWVNDELVNEGRDCTASAGQIAIQAEGAACEFRKLALTQL